MGGSDNYIIPTCTPYADINELLQILSERKKSYLWLWAREQILKIAEKMTFFEDKENLLTALVGRHSSTGLEHFKEIQEELESYFGFSRA